MIYVYEGTPGSGKSLHATEEGIIGQNRRGGTVANFDIRRPKLRKDGSSKWVYVPSDAITVQMLKEHAERWHRVGRESEGLLIVDEAHRLLNHRKTYSSKSVVDQTQMDFVTFLAEHRHWGYDVILIIQSLRMLDRHARFLAELRVKHFKWNSFWFLRWFPIPIFGRVTYQAQFQMRGRLSFSLGLMAYGRYDHLAMRRGGAVRGGGSAGVPPAPAVS